MDVLQEAMASGPEAAARMLVEDLQSTARAQANEAVATVISAAVARSSRYFDRLAAVVRDARTLAQSLVARPAVVSKGDDTVAAVTAVITAADVVDDDLNELRSSRGGDMALALAEGRQDEVTSFAAHAATLAHAIHEALFMVADVLASDAEAALETAAAAKYEELLNAAHDAAAAEADAQLQELLAHANVTALRAATAVLDDVIDIAVNDTVVAAQEFANQLLDAAVAAGEAAMAAANATVLPNATFFANLPSTVVVPPAPILINSTNTTNGTVVNVTTTVIPPFNATQAAIELNAAYAQALAAAKAAYATAQAQAVLDAQAAARALARELIVNATVAADDYALQLAVQATDAATAAFDMAGTVEQFAQPAISNAMAVGNAHRAGLMAAAQLEVEAELAVYRERMVEPLATTALHDAERMLDVIGAKHVGGVNVAAVWSTLTELAYDWECLRDAWNLGTALVEGGEGSPLGQGTTMAERADWLDNDFLPVAVCVAEVLDTDTLKVQGGARIVSIVARALAAFGEASEAAQEAQGTAEAALAATETAVSSVVTTFKEQSQWLLSPVEPTDWQTIHARLGMVVELLPIMLNDTTIRADSCLCGADEHESHIVIASAHAVATAKTAIDPVDGAMTDDVSLSEAFNVFVTLPAAMSALRDVADIGEDACPTTVVSPRDPTLVRSVAAVAATALYDIESALGNVPFVDFHGGKFATAVQQVYSATVVMDAVQAAIDVVSSAVAVAQSPSVDSVLGAAADLTALVASMDRISAPEDVFNMHSAAWRATRSAADRDAIAAGAAAQVAAYEAAVTAHAECLANATDGHPGCVQQARDRVAAQDEEIIAARANETASRRVPPASIKLAEAHVAVADAEVVVAAADVALADCLAAQAAAKPPQNERYTATFTQRFGAQGFKLYYTDARKGQWGYCYSLSRTCDFARVYHNYAEDASKTIQQLKEGLSGLLAADYTNGVPDPSIVHVEEDTLYIGDGHRYFVELVGAAAGVDVPAIGMTSQRGTFSWRRSQNGGVGEIHPGCDVELAHVNASNAALEVAHLNVAAANATFTARVHEAVAASMALIHAVQVHVNAVQAEHECLVAMNVSAASAEAAVAACGDPPAPITTVPCDPATGPRLLDIDDAAGQALEAVALTTSDVYRELAVAEGASVSMMPDYLQQQLRDAALAATDMPTLRNISSAGDTALAVRLATAGAKVRAGVTAQAFVRVARRIRVGIDLVQLLIDASKEVATVVTDTTAVSRQLVSSPSVDTFAEALGIIQDGVLAVREIMRGVVADASAQITASYNDVGSGTVGSVTCAATRAQGECAASSDGGSSPPSACELLHAGGVVPPQCCPELADAGIEAPECPASPGCLALHSSGESIPATCCPELWANGLSHSDCPVPLDCATIVADAMNGTDVLPSSTVLPPHCCFDARVAADTRGHAVCAAISATADAASSVYDAATNAASSPAELADQIRCVLSRLAFSELADLGVDAAPANRRRRRLSGMSVGQREAELNAAVQSARDAARRVAAEGYSAVTDLASAAAQAVGAIERHAGVVVHHACAVEAGFGHWIAAAALLTPAQLDFIAETVAFDTFTSADEVITALWDSIQEGGDVATAAARQLGVTLAWNLAHSVAKEHGVPPELAPLLAPAEAVDCPVPQLKLQPFNETECRSRELYRQLHSSLEATAAAATSRLGRLVAVGAQAANTVSVHTSRVIAGLQLLARIADAASPAELLTDLGQAMEVVGDALWRIVNGEDPGTAASSSGATAIANHPDIPQAEYDVELDLGVDANVGSIAGPADVFASVSRASTALDDFVAISRVLGGMRDLPTLAEQLVRELVPLARDQPSPDAVGVPMHEKAPVGVRLTDLGSRRLGRLMELVDAMLFDLNRVLPAVRDHPSFTSIATMSVAEHQDWLERLQSLLSMAKVTEVAEIARRWVAVLNTVSGVVTVVSDFVSETGPPTPSTVNLWFSFVSDDLVPAVSSAIEDITAALTASGLRLTPVNLGWFDDSLGGVIGQLEGVHSTVAACTIACPTADDVERVSNLIARARMVQDRMVAVHASLATAVADSKAAGNNAAEAQAAAATDDVVAAFRPVVQQLAALSAEWAAVADTELQFALEQLDVWPALSAAFDELQDAASGALAFQSAGATIIDALGRADRPLKFAVIVGGLVTSTFDPVPSGCVDAEAFGEEVAGVVTARAAATLLSIAQVPGEDAVAVRAALSAGFGSASPTPQLQKLLTHVNGMLAFVTGEQAVVMNEVRMLVFQAMLAQLCSTAREVNAVVSATVAIVSASASVASAAAGGDFEDASAKANGELIPAIQDARNTMLGPVLDRLASRGRTALVNTLDHAKRLAADLGASQLLNPTQCSAAGIARGECEGVHSFVTSGAGALMKLVAEELQEVLPTELLLAIPQNGELQLTGEGLLERLQGRGVSLKQLLHVASVLSVARYALDALHAATAREELSAGAPAGTMAPTGEVVAGAYRDALADLDTLLAPLQSMHVFSAGGSIQPVFWGLDGMGSFFDQVAGLATAVEELASALLSDGGLMGLDPDSFSALLDQVIDVATRVRDSASAGTVASHLVVGSLRATIGEALDRHDTVVAATGSGTLSTAGRDAIITLDGLLAPLSAAGAVEGMAPSARTTLENALTAATAEVGSAAPIMTAIVSSLRSSFALMRVLPSLERVVAALESVRDSQAMEAARLVFDVVQTVQDGGSLGDAATIVFDRLVEQAEPLVAVLAVPSGGVIADIVNAATTAANDAADAASAASVPTLSLGPYTGPAPWAVLKLARLEAALRKLVVQVPQLAQALATKVVDMGIVDVSNSGSAAAVTVVVPTADEIKTLLVAVKDLALEVVLMLKEVTASSEAVEQELPGVVPASVGDVITLLADTFKVRCAVSCDFDLTLARAMRMANAAGNVLAALTDLSRSTSIADVLGKGRDILLAAVDELRSSGIDPLESEASLEPTPTSDTGAGLFGAAVEHFVAAIDDGKVVAADAAAGVDAVAALRAELVALAHALSESRFYNTFSGMRDLSRRSGDVRDAMHRVVEAGFDFAAFRAEAETDGDVTLAAAAWTLQRLTPVMEAWLDAQLGARGVNVAGASVAALDVLAQQIATVDELASLTLDEFAERGTDLSVQLSGSLLTYLGDLTVAELGNLHLMPVLDVVREFSLAVEATVGASCGGVAEVQQRMQDAVAVAFSTGERLENILLATLAAGLPLPLSAASMYTLDTAVQYNLLLSALSEWRAALADAVAAIRDGLDDSQVAGATEAAKAAADAAAAEHAQCLADAEALMSSGCSTEIAARDAADADLDAALAANTTAAANAATAATAYADASAAASTAAALAAAAVTVENDCLAALAAASLAENEKYVATFKQEFGSQGFKVYWAPSGAKPVTYKFNHAEDPTATISELKAALARLLKSQTGGVEDTSAFDVVHDTTYTGAGNRYTIEFVNALAGVDVASIGMVSQAGTFSWVHTQNGVPTYAHPGCDAETANRISRAATADSTAATLADKQTANDAAIAAAVVAAADATEAQRAADAAAAALQACYDANAASVEAAAAAKEACGPEPVPGPSTVQETCPYAPVLLRVLESLLALGPVSDERFDVGPRMVASGSIELVTLMGYIVEVARLIEGGADFTTVRRLASKAVEELYKRLQEAVLKQASGIVSTFTSFATETTASYGGDSDGANPDAAHPDKSASAMTQVTDFFGALGAFKDGPLAEIQDAVDQANGAVDMVRDFRNGIVGQVQAKLQVIDDQVALANSVFDQVMGLMDMAIEFTSSTEQLEVLANRVVTIVVTELDSRVKIVIDTFDVLVIEINTVEFVVLNAIREGKDMAKDVAKQAKEMLFALGGGILQDLADTLEQIDVFLNEKQQQLSAWKDVANLALEITLILRDVDAEDNLKLGQLAWAFSTIVRGIEYVEEKVAQLQRFRDLVNSIFNQLTDVEGWVNPFIESVPLEEPVKQMFARIRSKVLEVKAEAIRMKNDLFDAMTDLVDKAIAEVLERLEEYLGPISGALKLVQDTMKDAKKSVDSTFNLVDRREYLYEQMENVLSYLDPPLAAIATVQGFVDTFMGGVTSAVDTANSLSGSRRLIGAEPQGACTLDLTQFKAFDAAKAAVEAVTTLTTMIPSLGHMATVGEELFALVGISSGQKCVEGASCGLVTIGKRLSEVVDLLTVFETGLAALQDFGDALPEVAGAVTGVSKCLANVPEALEAVRKFADDFMSGRLFGIDVEGGMRAILQQAYDLENQANRLALTVDEATKIFRDNVLEVASVVNAGFAQVKDTMDVLQGGLVWAKKTADSLTDVEALKLKMQEYIDSLDIAGIMRDNLDILMGHARDFVRQIVIRTDGGFQSILDTTSNLIDQMRDGRNKVDEKLDLLLALAEEIERQIGLGKLTTDLTSWKKLSYCSDDTLPDGVCLRQEERSKYLYRNLIYPAMYTRFFYETIPPYNDPNRMVGNVPTLRWYCDHAPSL